MHPAMFLRGSQARFTDPNSGEVIQPGSLPHQMGDFVMAAIAAGFRLDGVGEYAPDAEFAARYPRAAKYVGWPMLVLLRLGTWRPSSTNVVAGGRQRSRPILLGRCRGCFSDHGPSMMSEERLLNPEPPTSEFNAEPRRGRRLQTGARTLVVLVATCGVVFWVAQYLWESQHPAYSAASGLLARSPTERVSAAKLLVQAGIGDTAIAIPPLVTALMDPAAEVRIAACGALRPLVSDAITTGSAADAVLAANTALIWSLNDPNADVRVATARVLEAIISLNVSAEMIDLDGVFLGLSQTIGDQVRKVRIAALGALGSTACKLTTSPPAALTANLRTGAGI
jgi:hypothetical protein